jgi:hypothetical protein
MRKETTRKVIGDKEEEKRKRSRRRMRQKLRMGRRAEED